MRLQTALAPVKCTLVGRPVLLHVLEKALRLLHGLQFQLALRVRREHHQTAAVLPTVPESAPMGTQASAPRLPQVWLTPLAQVLRRLVALRLLLKLVLTRGLLLAFSRLRLRGLQGALLPPLLALQVVALPIPPL